MGTAVNCEKDLSSEKFLCAVLSVNLLLTKAAAYRRYTTTSSSLIRLIFSVGEGVKTTTMLPLGAVISNGKKSGDYNCCSIVLLGWK